MRAAPDLVTALRAGRKGAWERFWFGEASLVRLAAFRIVVLSVALFGLHFHRASLLQGEALGMIVVRRRVPVYFLDVLGVPALEPGTVDLLFVLLSLLIVVGIVGFYTRTVCALVAAGMLLWVGSAYSLGQPHHEYGALAFALCALPFGPVGARLSLDFLRTRWRSARSGPGLPSAAPEVAGDALLPIRFVQVTLALSYFLAGASKLAIGGWEWLNGYTLQGVVLEFNSPFARWVADRLQLWQVLSWGVVLTQVLAFTALLWRPVRWVVIPAIVAVHLGSWWTMETGTFLALWALQAAYVDLELVPSFVVERVSRGHRLARVGWGSVTLAVVVGLAVAYAERGPASLAGVGVALVASAALVRACARRVDVIFDGGCGLCRQTASTLQALDWCGLVRLLPTTDWERVAAAQPVLRLDECLEDLHLVDADGRVHRGFAAYRALAWRLPAVAPMAGLLYLPGMSAAGERIYRFAAERRVTTSCSTG